MAFDSVLYARATVPNERRHGLAERGDYDTQPRLLQPVAQDTDITVANGFTTANLRPGDMLFVADSDQVSETTKEQLFFRNGANDGWIIFKLTTGGEVADD